MTTTEAPERTPEEIRAITDPEQRGRAAAEAWAGAAERLADARARRDAAALHLLRNEGWKPVDVYRLAGLSRRLFGPIAASLKGPPAPVVEDAETVLKEQGKRFWVEKALTREYATLRTEAGREMLAKGRPNVEVARVLSLSTARVTQIRRGRH